MATHSSLSPSKAATWATCPGAPRLWEGIPDQGSGYADLGTAKHTLTERCWRERVGADAYLGTSIDVKGTNFVVDEDFVEHVDYALDVLHTLRITYPGHEIYLEQRVDLSPWLGEGQGGTADVIMLDPDTGHMLVCDWKFGRGVRVDATRNSQLFLYALGAYGTLASLVCDPTRIDVLVVQPLLDHIDADSMDLDQLLQFGQDMMTAAERTRDPQAALVPGPKQCRWCKAKGLCPALADEVIETLPVAAESFADLTVAAPPQASELTNEQLAAILPAEDMIREFLDAVRTEAVRRAGEGELIPGHKLVQGKKGPRQWAKGEETAIAQYLDETVRLRHDEMYTQKLISPTQVEKLVGPVQYRKLAQYITQSDGALAIAPVSDKRPAVNPVALPEQFEVITQE